MSAPRRRRFSAGRRATFEFVAADGAKITPESLKGKVVVLDFWATWCQPCLQNMPNLDRVREKYKDNDKVRILPINIESPEVKDETVKQAMADLKLGLPVIRDPGQSAFKVFATTGIPTMYVLGADGTAQYHQAGADPAVDQVQHLSSIIDAVLAGEDMAKKVRADFERSMMEAPAAVGSLSADGTPAVPEQKIAPASQPEKFALQELWSCDSVQRPGNIYVAPQPQGPPRLYVIDDWQTVVELDQHGKLVARRELNLPEGAVVAFMRTAVDGQKNRYFALSAIGQQTAHVFDQDWQRVLTFPVGAKHPGIFDLQLTDLDGLGQLRLLVSYLDVVGVQCVSLQGQRIWSNRSLRDVFSMAITEPAADGKRLVLCANSQGTLASLNYEGKRGKDLAVQGQFVRLIFGNDLNGDGKNEYVGVGLTTTGADVFLGVGANGAAEWTYALPEGPQHPALDQISTGRLLGDREHWIVAGQDGSLHLVGAHGDLLDRFNVGAVIDGFAATHIDGKPALLISTEKGLKCFAVEAKP